MANRSFHLRRQPDLEDKPLRWLVTGAPCSGTMWVAEILTRSGLPTAHEMRMSPVGDGIGPFLGESSSFAPFFFRQLEPEVVVVHLVRDPFETVRSMMRKRVLDGPFSSVEIEFEMPKIETEADRYAAFWISWNFIIRERILSTQEQWFGWTLGEIGVREVTDLGHAVGMELDPIAVRGALELPAINHSTESPNGEERLSPGFVGMLSERIF